LDPQFNGAVVASCLIGQRDHATGAGKREKLTSVALRSRSSELCGSLAFESLLRACRLTSGQAEILPWLGSHLKDSQTHFKNSSLGEL
jgi:hypothetical protein